MTVYFKDPKLSAICCIPMQKLDLIWGPETNFMVRKNSNGDYFKIDYEKWEKDKIIADIIEEIIKGIYKRELERILNNSDSSYNGNFSFSSFGESLDESFSSKRNAVVENLKIDAKFDTSNLGRKRNVKRINYADMDEFKPEPKQRKPRKRSVKLPKPIYAHVTASIPETFPNSYVYNPLASYQNEFIPKAESKPKKRQRKPKKSVAPVYTEQVALKYTQTINAVVARYNEICQEVLQDEFTQEIPIYNPVDSVEILPDISEEVLQIIPDTSFKSLPSLTDSFEVERFFQENKTSEIPSNVKPFAEFFIEPNGVNDYRVQTVNPDRVSISIPLAKIQEKEVRQERKIENFERKRKSDDLLKSKEKRRKFVNHSTQTDRETKIVNHQQHIDQANCATMVERSDDNKNMVFIFNFYAAVAPADIAMLKGAINEAVSLSFFIS